VLPIQRELEQLAVLVVTELSGLLVVVVVAVAVALAVVQV
jgi:hypothetical protein